MCIIDINGDEPITAQGALDEHDHRQTPRGKSKVKISLCRRKIYQRTYIEEICSRFDQVRPVVSHIGVRHPKKPPKPNNIGGGSKRPQRPFWNGDLFVSYYKNKNISFL